MLPWAIVWTIDTIAEPKTANKKIPSITGPTGDEFSFFYNWVLLLL